MQADKIRADVWEKDFTGGDIATSPVIIDGAVVFGALDHYVYALDSESGKLRWKFRTGGLIAGSPNLIGDKIFIGSNDGYLYALDKGGSLLWKFRTGNMVQSSPCVFENTVYFGSNDKYLYAIDADTGEIKWKFLTGGPIYTSPAISNDCIFFGSGDEDFYALSLEGKLVWKFFTGGIICMPPTIFADGREAWRFGSGINSHDTDMSIFFGSYNNNFYCLDVGGRMKWLYRTGGILDWSYPTVFNGAVYFGSWDNHLYALSSGSGEFLWKTRVGGFVSSPLIYSNKIFFGSGDGYLYAFSLDGKEFWRFRTGGPVYSMPVVFNDILYFGSSDSYFYALSVDEKKPVWKFTTGGRPSLLLKETLKQVADISSQQMFTSWKPEITGASSLLSPKSSYSGALTQFSQAGSQPGYSAKNIYRTEAGYETGASAEYRGASPKKKKMPWEP